MGSEARWAGMGVALKGGWLQAVWCSFVSVGCSSLWPAILGLMASSLLLAADKQRRLAVLEGAWHAVPAWCATLMFMVEPAADLVRFLPYVIDTLILNGLRAPFMSGPIRM